MNFPKNVFILFPIFSPNLSKPNSVEKPSIVSTALFRDFAINSDKSVNKSLFTTPFTPSAMKFPTLYHSTVSTNDVSPFIPVFIAFAIAVPNVSPSPSTVTNPLINVPMDFPIF